jgi:hypothetical protein
VVEATLQRGDAGTQLSPASFRDPSGFVFSRDGLVYRQVNQSYRPDYDLLMASGLYDELVKEALLVAHEEAPESLAPAPGAYKILKPTQLDFVSYPYEWCFGQLKDAALATLAIQKKALARGLSLKDASSYNIQLHGGRITFIDTLSFEAYAEGKPWVAYRQFCQHFLAPLALMSKSEVRLNQLMRIYIDGVPLDLASKLLPWRTALSFGLGLHIHAHAKTQRKYAGEHQPKQKQLSARFSKRSFEALVDNLESTIQGLQFPGGDFEWADYYAANNNYSAEGMAEKRELVGRMVRAAKPSVVWDLGANTGVFSRIALESGARLALAWDIDPACVQANYQHVRQKNEKALIPLLLDLTNPSPGLGWANAERASLSERGPADLVLALGLVHHLAISNNVPLPRIAEFLASLTRQLVIEWVPKEDSQVQKLLATRQDVFPNYVQADFERAFGASFVLDEVLPIQGTKRTLYRMRAR